jgi:hypothetical protein
VVFLLRLLNEERPEVYQRNPDTILRRVRRHD